MWHTEHKYYFEMPPVVSAVTDTFGKDCTRIRGEVLRRLPAFDYNTQAWKNKKNKKNKKKTRVSLATSLVDDRIFFFDWVFCR